MMQRFVETQSLTGSHLQTDIFEADFVNTLPKDNLAYSYNNIEEHQAPCNIVQFLELPQGPLNISLECLKAFNSMIKTIGPFKEKILTAFEIAQLEEVLNGLLDQPVVVHNKFCIKFGKLLLGDDLIGSAVPNCSLSSSLIQAFWPTAPDISSSVWYVYW